MAKILDSKKTYESLKRHIRKEIQALGELSLASVAIGDNFSTKVYRSSQKKLAKVLGIKYIPIDLTPTISFEDFQSEITKLNKDTAVNGIIVNKSFPSGWPDEEVFSQLDEKKDVEGMHPVNLGKLFLAGGLFLMPPTVRSVLDLLTEALPNSPKSALKGQRVTIVGFSAIVGQPLAVILGKLLATVSITHIGTYEKGDLPEYINNADVVISAVGKPNLIKGEWIKQGAIVIDIGTGQENGRVIGDVEFTTAKKKASVITPVPGGVGRLTTIYLFDNLVNLAKK